MKNLICLLVSVLLLVSASAFAETAYVTICTGEGEIALAREAVELSDTDGDGVISINDALCLAHEQAYEGGAAAGFHSEDQGYGLSMTRLWGEENGGSYGYYVNNASAISLLDELADGSHVQAYAYQDLTTWADTFCYFDQETVNPGEIELTLTALVFDANWVAVPTPVEGAVITIDGVDTGAVTDANGKAVLTVSQDAGVISARSDAMTLVPPVCLVSAA